VSRQKAVSDTDSRTNDAVSAAARNFAELVGYQGIQERLVALRASGKLPPVMLFAGREGLGKRRLAAFVAALFVCEQSTGCGQCSACREVIAGRNPELLWIDPDDASASGPQRAAGIGSLKIEHVSALQEHLSYCAARVSGAAGTPARLGVVIDADRMTEQAANRLLKTLEEPPSGSCIVLTTSRPGALLPTILSRVVRWNVPPPGAIEGRQILSRLLGQRTPAVTEASLIEALRRSGGSPGGAMRLLSDDQAHMAAGEAVRRFLEEEDATVQLRLAEEFSRVFGWTPVQLIDHCEWELNKIYRSSKVSRGGMAVPLRVAERRTLLSRVRWLAGRRQIHLNTQLMAEGIALGGKVT